MTNEGIDCCKNELADILQRIENVRNTNNLPQKIKNSLSGAKSLCNKARYMLEEERQMEGQMSVQDILDEMEL